MIHWLHHLFAIQCDICAEERTCKSCEILREQLDIMRTERDTLLSHLINRNTPARPESEPDEVNTPISIGKNTIPWQVKRELLEKEDRERAKILRSVGPTIEELENDLRLDDLELKDPEHKDADIKIGTSTK
jgi:hypothetical protein